MSDLEKVLKKLDEVTYTFRFNLLSNKSTVIEFRPIKVKDQKKLIVDSANETQINQLKALMELLQSCIKTSNLKVENFTFQDFIWGIINLRMKSQGETIDVVGICDKCGHKVLQLPVNLENKCVPGYLDGIKNSEVKIDDLIFKLRLPRMKDIINMPSDLSNSDLEYHTLTNMIDYVSVGEEVLDLTLEEKIQVLDNLDSKYLETFKTFEKDNEFGPTLNIDFKCPACQHDNKIAIKEDILNFFF